MFVCGPTVQGLMHMGHARTYIFYDVLARYLKFLGNKVRFVINITDVDERISDAARKAGVEPMDYANMFAGLFLDDMNRLGIGTVTSYQRVSDYIPGTMEQISKLLEKRNAYAVDGWVYFDVSTFPDFGRLSHMTKRELALRPLELSTKKRNLLDFSLWRPEILVAGKWHSPWGDGSPGWHIQDTAITLSKFGPSYDIHGGAYELIYPHHEAEIAQAECITGVKPVVRYWIHTRLVNTEGEKMSKSAGNIYTVRDALTRFTPDEIRFFFLKRHYREDIGLEGLEDSAKEYRELKDRIGRCVGASPRTNRKTSSGLPAPFSSAMNDDFDTPGALSWLERATERVDGHQPDKRTVRAISKILGLDLLAKP
jgi:cysteinyl-tRNA synthetase